MLYKLLKWKEACRSDGWQCLDQCLFTACTWTTLRTGRSRFRIPLGIEVFFFLVNVQPDCGAHPFLFSGYRDSYLGVNPHVLSRLRMNGAIPLLLLYAFMAWTRRTTFLSFLK
jgi:hypothetical protein